MNKQTMGWVHVISFLLVLVGALNWGLIGLFNYNLVTSLFGLGALTQATYILVGLAAVYLALTHRGECKTCDMMMKPAKKKRR